MKKILLLLCLCLIVFVGCDENMVNNNLTDFESVNANDVKEMYIENGYECK